jgi:hypothetical protein
MAIPVFDQRRHIFYTLSLFKLIHALLLCLCCCQKELLTNTKQCKKEKCWAYYKSQQLYIDAMREAKEDLEFDPRRTHLKIGKDGQFKKIGTSKVVVLMNPLTVQYLCHAYDIPYAFETKAFIPDDKGKTVLTCKKLATEIFNHSFDLQEIGNRNF